MSKSIARKATTGLLALAMTAGVGVGFATTASAAEDIDATGLHVNKGVTRWIKSPDGFANIRSGAGVGFKVLRRLNTCTRVTIVETKGGWSRLSDGGWVANWLLSSSPVPCKPTPPPSKPGKPGKPRPPAPAPLCRVFVGQFKTADAARAAARRIGGGAFIVANPRGGWSVQVGAFAVRANANARAAQFKNAVVVGACK